MSDRLPYPSSCYICAKAGTRYDLRHLSPVCDEHYDEADNAAYLAEREESAGKWLSLRIIARELRETDRLWNGPGARMMARFTGPEGRR